MEVVKGGLTFFWRACRLSGQDINVRPELSDDPPPSKDAKKDDSGVVKTRRKRREEMAQKAEARADPDRCVRVSGCMHDCMAALGPARVCKALTDGSGVAGGEHAAAALPLHGVVSRRMGGSWATNGKGF